MSYFKLLGLQREPFSTNPDPDFFYQTRGHMAAFYRLRVAIDLKRGLNLILGDVGTGKSTLMRKLMGSLSQEPGYIPKVIMDPTASSEHDCLVLLSHAFGLKPGFRTVSHYKKTLENFLFDQGLVNGKTIVLFIDEAQKLSSSSMEVLRLLLNYETNEIKLIQIVLFGQMELLPMISQMRNLWDRITLKYVINPLERDEIRELIHFRLRQAGYIGGQPLFDDTALDAIYEYTQGYPRRTTMLCHDALEYLVMHDRPVVDGEVVRALIQQEVKPTISDHRLQTAGFAKDGG
ncbi:MAG: hypothetical protein A3G91_04755 [Omnitrophica WOR_2 bacterium RIFCSPLOWO2_12_FULL_50_9]|nr:MAG: hypothetical protein A3G91_04755 [Omnitrophica WOR_2 bacterium RIFCSPLOWO2_12_FULL_50_9]